MENNNICQKCGSDIKENEVCCENCEIDINIKDAEMNLEF